MTSGDDGTIIGDQRGNGRVQGRWQIRQLPFVGNASYSGGRRRPPALL